jgi:F420-dependent oxidoreductase-like protein
MRFAVWPDQARPWTEIAAIADHAESAGWDGCYVYDHFMPHDEGGDILDGPVHEGWTLLTAIACRTERLRLGTLVLGNLYRHPAVVANMAATLDHVSDGRLVLGLGAGWQQNEHRAYGIPLPPPRPRLDQFEEALAVITSLLREPRTTFHGQYYDVDDAPCDPKPVQERLPVLIGSSGEKRGIPLAARWADVWNSWSTLESFRRMSGVLDAAAALAGRDPSSIERSTQAEVLFADAPTREVFDADERLTGTPEQMVEVLAGYADSGLDEFVVPDDVAVPITQRLEMLERFRLEVVEPLRRA